MEKRMKTKSECGLHFALSLSVFVSVNKILLKSREQQRQPAKSSTNYV